MPALGLDSHANLKKGSIGAADWSISWIFQPPTMSALLRFLMLCGFLLFLPGFFSIPPIDRDEARFAQATKQMVESGDLVDIRFQDDVRYKKPVGIYWMQAAAVETASALACHVPRSASGFTVCRR